MRIATEKDFSNECKGCQQYLRDCLCEVFEYSGAFSFKSDIELTQEQLNQLMDIISLQIIEPVDENQEDETYKTQDVLVVLEAN